MANIQKVKGIRPQIHPSVWLANNATVTGDVQIAKNSTLWFQSVIRGDVNQIRIGEAVNIQDGAIIHCTYQKADCQIGDRVSIGHAAIVHGCHIGDEVLIGMRAVVMDHVVVPSHCLIAAGSVVLENQKLEPGYLYAGIPAVKKRKLSKDEVEEMILQTSKNYIQYAQWYAENA